MRRNSLLFIVAIVLLYVMIYVFGSPSKTVVNDETVIVNKGIPDVLLFLLGVFVIILAPIVMKKIREPIAKALDEECDPRKHFVLSRAFIRFRNRQLFDKATDYLYLGDFLSLFECTEKMISSRSSKLRFCGLFNKARGCFFKGDQETFSETVKQFEDELAKRRKRFGKKQKEALDSWAIILHLLDAILKKDADAAGQYRTVGTWNQSKITVGYVNYVKGLAAKLAGDNEAADSLFRSVAETCRKNILAGLAEKQLNCEETA